MVDLRLGGSRGGVGLARNGVNCNAISWQRRAKPFESSTRSKVPTCFTLFQTRSPIFMAISFCRSFCSCSFWPPCLSPTLSLVSWPCPFCATFTVYSAKSAGQHSCTRKTYQLTHTQSLDSAPEIKLPLVIVSFKKSWLVPWFWPQNAK